MKLFKEKKYSIVSLVAKYSFIFIIVFSIAMPLVFVGADTQSVNTEKIDNPLGPNGPETIPDFIEKAITIVMYIGVPILVLAIIYAGFLYVKAQGNSGELEVAHRTLRNTLIGGFLLLGAFVIAKAIGTTIEDIRQGAS